ncbi:sensor histidine kinase [Aminobacter sp. MET-1]|uniref:sensor histidine kinase n=1 Tax=Aminobacter sp. MET-1 TaxID=2951085 RepID=UPI002269E894|nr:PAS domain S-box protein [Aminobacter sp. MET-1]MCX8570794.1 PAS domain S-box protein [Aminobacter sp. MET-1]
MTTKASPNPAELLGAIPVAELPLPTYTTDIAGRIIWFNDAARLIWGQAPAPEARWSGGLGVLHSDGLPLALDASPMALAVGQRRAQQGSEIALVRGDGTILPVLVYSSPLFHEHGPLIGVVNSLIDVSRHKKAERLAHQLAAIVESSEDAIISKDLCGVIQSWNAGAQRLFGYRQDEMVGRHISILIPSDRIAEEDEILTKIRKGDRIDHFDTIRRRKDGSLVPISLTVSPIKDDKGKIIGASKIARNISDRIDKELRIHQLMREVNHRVKNQFAVILSMIGATSRRSKDPQSFQRQFRERIMGLSRSHDLLVEAEWKGASLYDLATSQIMPFAEVSQLNLSGEPLLLATTAVQNLGIAFHELSTNSAKHGALSTTAGRVSVSWQIQGHNLRLDWRETGGPHPGAEPPIGFGRIVLEQVVPRALNGNATFLAESDSVRWTLVAPLSSIEPA